MTAKEKLFEALKDNETLRDQLEKALRENADGKAIESLLRGAGVEPEAEMVPELLALRQKRELEDITEQEMDAEQLETIRGGGNGICEQTADCDHRFQYRRGIPKERRCKFWVQCDEVFWTT